MKQALTPESIDELFRQTLVGDYDDDEDRGGPWEAVSKLQAIGSRAVWEHAAGWARNNKPNKRRRGIDILAQLGKSEENPQVAFAEETYAIVVETLETELDPQIIDSCLVAFGHLGNPAAVPLILPYQKNEDPDVRFAACFALSCFADDARSVAALLALTEDPDDDIRDWATFGLGVKSNADSEAIREALLERLDDENQDTREEAVAGLGKRGDLRALPTLIDLLHEEEVSYGVVEAACHLLEMTEVNEEWAADDYIQALQDRYPDVLEAE
jgi:HEAT repeat protein